jgi:hypothetical protein
MTELDRATIARHMCSTPPRCISEFIARPTDAPEAWKGSSISTWQLWCSCGSDDGAFLGYPLRHYTDQFEGDAFVGPLGFLCAKCKQTLEVLDTKEHGYHAESCSFSSHISGEGPRVKFVCRNCGGSLFSVKVSFFYWEAVIDLVEDEPAEFAPVSQNLFNEFVAHGRCIGCCRVSRFTDFGKL